MLRHKIRNGRDVDQNLYMQGGDNPAKGDIVIGHICDPGTARNIVDAVNRDTARQTAEPLLPSHNGASLRGLAEDLADLAVKTPSAAREMQQAAEVLRAISWHIDNDGKLK